MYSIKRFSKTSKDEYKAAGVIGGALGANLLAYKGINKVGNLDDPELMNKLTNKAGELGLKIVNKDSPIGAYYDSSSKSIILPDSFKDSATLSHELGHHKVQTSKNPLIRGTQSSKLAKASRFMNNLGLTSIASYQAGKAAGKAAARREANGLEEDNLSKYGHHAVAIGSNIPILASEALASGHGLKLLKEAGASKKDLAKAAGKLAVAGGSYVTGTAFNEGLAMYGKARAKRKELDRINNSKSRY